MVAFAGYPLMIGDEIVGVLAMFSRRPLSETDFSGLATVAQGIALGIARQRGVEALRERAEQLTAADRGTRAHQPRTRSIRLCRVARSQGAAARHRQSVAVDRGGSRRTACRKATREHLELMRGRVHRMEALIDGILEYSRAGRLSAEPETVDTAALARERRRAARRPGAGAGRDRARPADRS